MLFILGTCWGSFLNVYAYRSIQQIDWVLRRSFCQSCNSQLSWFELIPLLSWLILGGRCGTCRQSISILYPLIELLAGILAVLWWWYIPGQYKIVYAIFFSGLLITIRTDSEFMLIETRVTRFLIVLGFLASTTHYLPITIVQSVFGALFGYGILWLTSKIYLRARNIEGIGEGDLELLAAIGACTGVAGAWISLAIGAFSGLFATLAYILITQQKPSESVLQMPLPFGVFLAVGAITYVFLSKPLSSLLLGL